MPGKPTGASGTAPELVGTRGVCNCLGAYHHAGTLELRNVAGGAADNGMLVGWPGVSIGPPAIRLTRVQRKPFDPPMSAAPKRRPEPVTHAWRLWWELAGVLFLAGLAVFYLSVSWRKWPDVLVDSSRELYTPWRLADGAVLYRDIDCFYGPLSQYFNATVFALMGPGLMHLIAANLAIFTAIVACLYGLLRRAWGALAAVAGAAVFIGVFGFAHLVRNGNFNFAFPYAHETTHGFLVCLLLAVALLRWLGKATPAASALIGGLLGLTLLLKPEIVAAGACAAFAALALHWRWGGRPTLTMMLAGFAGLTLPSLLFAGYFCWQGISWTEALAYSGRAWSNAVFTTRYLAVDSFQARSIGLDQPWFHLGQHAIASLLALVLFAVLGSAAWICGRQQKSAVRYGAGLALVGGLATISILLIHWPEVGRCLPGLVGLYAIWKIVALVAGPLPPEERGREAARLVVTALAIGFLARMALAGRIYQYGFFQAALAGVMVPAVLLGELPARLEPTRTRGIFVAGMLALLVPGLVAIAHSSNGFLEQKTLAVGEGADQFYSYPPGRDPTAQIVATMAAGLRKRPASETVLVLPEGQMINYLARKRCPVAQFSFYSVTTVEGREAGLVEELERDPPRWVVLISRDLREYDIVRYGEAPGRGQQLLQWVSEHYARVGAMGDDPLDYRLRGAILFARKPGARGAER